MKVNVEAIKRENVEIDIDEVDAFKLLCKTLRMEFVYKDLDLYAAYNKNTEEYFVMKNGEVYDYRGKLFLALCKLAENIIPNCELRNMRVVETEESTVWM